MPIECASNLFNAAISLGGVFAGGVVGYLSARRIATLTARRAACAKFIAAFSPAIGFLDKARRHDSDHDRPNASAFLRDAFVAHAAAIEDFRPFVRTKDLSAYQQAWETYCETAHAGTVEAEFMAEDIDHVDPRRALQDLIHSILRFAKT